MGKNPREARKLFLLAAEQSVTEAMAALSLSLLHGDGGSPDPQAAFRWVHKAAVKGNSRACNNLGVMYEKGTAVQRDDAEAVKWYRQAALLGEPRAVSNLSRMDDKGQLGDGL
ncbi:MAG: tetratricopeptide repeat protein [Kiritimatiellaeota bacterium]|nr:tetratricopeptide repeat protein [Kiritimatiellota bacterium]